MSFNSCIRIYSFFVPTFEESDRIVVLRVVSLQRFLSSFIVEFVFFLIMEILLLCLRFDCFTSLLFSGICTIIISVMS